MRGMRERRGIKAIENELEIPSAVQARSVMLFEERQNDTYRRTDRLFAKLMVFQWLAGIAAAIWISPKTWAGSQSQVHWHVWAALFIGGALTSFPVFLAWKRPGHALTRHVIAIGQMLTSALLIHLTGGRIETHFHVFGSLAFLAFYRDWRVLITGTIVVAGDHLIRGLYWPQSVFGVLTTSNWRWLEHAGWVVFEDFFLLIAMNQSRIEMRLLAERQAGLEALNQSIEQTVQDRTAELQQEVKERRATEIKLEQTHKQLMEISRQAGMAEVATSVLHNVGNVLNSVNTSSSLVAETARRSQVSHLTKAAALMQSHADDLPGFFANDPKGKQLPGFLTKLAGHLEEEHRQIITELDALGGNIDHIKEIVAMQQRHAKASGLREKVAVVDLVEDALRMNAGAMDRHGVQVVREYSATPVIVTEKHKVLQILINIIRNAKHALDDLGRAGKQMTLRVGLNGNNTVKISVLDNGIGIPPENLTRIFEHGFTTRQNGHGFGLHSGALAAQGLGGTLTARSPGTGLGAEFTLEFPCQLEEKKS